MSFLKGIKDTIEVRCEAIIEQGLERPVKVPFIAKYKKLKVDEAKELLDKAKNEEIRDEDIMNETLLGWRNMPGPDGNDVEFCEEALEEAMQHLGYRTALTDGFLEAQFGRKGALGKNS
jgi:hypothetical protein